MGQEWEGTSPWVGWCTSHNGPRRVKEEGGETLGADGPKAHPRARPPSLPLLAAPSLPSRVVAPLGVEP